MDYLAKASRVSHSLLILKQKIKYNSESVKKQKYAISL